MAPESVTVAATDIPEVEPLQEPSVPTISTTLEELEGLHSVRAILRDVVNPRRITMRDAQSYCAILLDDNNRKPICRLRFNNGQKLRIGIFSESKDEEIVGIASVDDIFGLAERLKATARLYIAE